MRAMGNSEWESFDKLSSEERRALRYRMLCQGVDAITDSRGEELARMTRSELAALRLRYLAEWVGDVMHEAPTHGWQAATARSLGIDPSYLAKILSGKRTSVGREVVDDVADTLGIGREYFEATFQTPDAMPEDVDPADYLRFDSPPRNVASIAESAAWTGELTRELLTEVERLMGSGALSILPGKKGEESRRLMRALATSVVDRPAIAAAASALMATDDRELENAGIRLAAALHAPRPLVGFLTVRGVPGRLFPAPAGDERRFIGAEQATPGDFEVGGKTYACIVERVPATPYFRKAIRTGDLELVPPDAFCRGQVSTTD